MRMLPVTNLPIQLSADSGFTPFDDPYTATITDASPGVVTAIGTALANGDSVILTTTGTLPSGLSPNTQYFVVDVSGDTFSLSATSGGSAINTGSAGSGVHTLHVLSEDVVDITIPFKADYTVVASNTTSGDLVLQESNDGSTWVTLATVPAGGYLEVTLSDDWIRVSTSATVYLLGN